MGEYVRAVREAAARARPRGGDLRTRRGWPHPREPAPRDRARGVGGVGGVAARGGHRRARPARRHAVRRARRRAAPRGPARPHLRRRGRRAVRPGQARLRPAGHPESRRYPSRRRRRAPDQPAQGAASTRWRCRTTSRAASAASSSPAGTPNIGSSWPTARRLTPDPTTHGHPSRAPDHPHRAPAVPRARSPAGPVEGRIERRRADRRVRRAALLHEPAQPGGPDHGRVPDQHPEAGTRLGVRAQHLRRAHRGDLPELQPRAGAPPGGLGLFAALPAVRGREPRRVRHAARDPGRRRSSRRSGPRRSWRRRRPTWPRSSA